MIAALCILACAWVIGISAGVAAVAACVTAGVQIDAAADAKDNQEEMEALTKAKQLKAEKMADFQNALRLRKLNADEIKTIMAAGTANVANQLLKGKEKYRLESLREKTAATQQVTTFTPRPSYGNRGRPVGH